MDDALFADAVDEKDDDGFTSWRWQESQEVVVSSSPSIVLSSSLTARRGARGALELLQLSVSVERRLLLLLHLVQDGCDCCCCEPLPILPRRRRLDFRGFEESDKREDDVFWDDVSIR